MVVRKGAVDAVGDGRQVVECDEEGSPRRAGGQARGQCRVVPCLLLCASCWPARWISSMSRWWCHHLTCPLFAGRCAVWVHRHFCRLGAASRRHQQGAAACGRRRGRERHGGAAAAGGGVRRLHHHQVQLGWVERRLAPLPALGVPWARGVPPPPPCRRASQRAFARQRRSMGATDLLAELGAVADELAEEG